MARVMLAGCMWFAMCLKLAFADSECVVGQDAGGLKSPSLVQVNSGRGTTLEAEDTSSESLMGFSQMVEDLAEKVAGHNYTLGKAESDALKMIRKWIENMNETLTLQHKEDQAEVDRARDTIQGCTSTTDKLLSNNVSWYKSATVSARSTHIGCRNKQITGGNLRNAACEDYDKYRKGQSPYLDNAEVPPSCLSSLTEDKVETSDPVTRQNMEKCLVGTHTWLLPLYSRYKLCERRTDNHTNITRKCDQLQLDFEKTFCLYELKLSDTCDYHTGCRNSNLEVRSATHAQVRISEAARKADYVTGKKVLCLFDVFLADNPNKTRTLDRCRALQVDTSPFDIIYHPEPGPSPCIKEPSKPCDEEWKTKEYSKLGVKVNTCTECPVPAPPTTTPAPANYCVGPRGGNDGFECLCSSGSGWCSWQNYASTWYGSFEDAKVKCNANAECLYLHDYAADGQNWRACRSVTFPGDEMADVAQKCQAAEAIASCRHASFVDSANPKRMRTGTYCVDMTTATAAQNGAIVTRSALDKCTSWTSGGGGFTANTEPCPQATVVMQLAPDSPCKNFNKNAVIVGDFGEMNCNWARLYSKRQVQASDLPLGMAFRCDSNDNIHVGFDRVSGRTSRYFQPFGNVECQNGNILLDWHGQRKSHPYKNNGDEVMIYINKDRSIDLYLNGEVKQRAKEVVPVNAFPVDFEIASADSGGFLRNVHWVNVKA